MATAPGYSAPRAEVEAYIRAQAQARGIDPNVALEVARREGLSNWQSSVVKNGVREPSWGPFQLYTGGGLGNKFQAQTGLDPSDPSTWQRGVDFALDEARKGGWGPWYGAKAAGITGFAGIDGNKMIPGSAPILPEGFTPPSTPQTPSTPNTPQQPSNPFGSVTELAKLFGGMAGGQQQQQAAAPPQASPLMPSPVALQALAEMLKNPSYGKPQRRFYA